MFAEYIQAALERAEYKVIDNPEPIFGEVPELEGVWATGMTVEECRRELISVIEGWIALRLKMGDSIPGSGKRCDQRLHGADGSCLGSSLSPGKSLSGDSRSWDSKGPTLVPGMPTWSENICM